MEIKDIIIPFTRSKSTFHLYALGDIHAGTIHCVEHDVKRKVKEIAKDEMALWIGMGDYAEWITPRDKRFDPDQKSIADWVESDNIAHTQEKWLVELFAPIKDKCLGLLYGNHENNIRVFNHNNVHKNICEKLGVTNLGFSCFLRLIFRRGKTHGHLVTGAFIHGSSCAVTEGAKLMALMRWMKSCQADLYGYAHLHDYIPKSLSRLEVRDSAEGPKIKGYVAVGATTGAWFKTYTQGIIASYGEQKAYPPTEICCAMYTINPNTGLLDVNKSV